MYGYSKYEERQNFAQPIMDAYMSPLDAEHMVRTYRIPNDCVSVVGCPDLIELEHITGRGFAVEEFTRRKKQLFI